MEPQKPVNNFLFVVSELTCMDITAHLCKPTPGLHCKFTTSAASQEFVVSRH